MQTEIEAKFLDINPSQLRAQLQALSATQTKQETLMKRCVFDYPDKRLEHIGAWVRVRDEGDKITCSYKQLIDRSLHGTKEINIVVSDFTKTCELLIATGLVKQSYQETKRETWTYKDSEITIDTWPWIPTFVEIESPSEDEIKQIATLLGFDWNDAMYGSVETAYMKYYNVTEKEVDSWKEIVFVNVPEGLESKRIN